MLLKILIVEHGSVLTKVPLNLMNIGQQISVCRYFVNTGQ